MPVPEGSGVGKPPDMTSASGSWKGGRCKEGGVNFYFKSVPNADKGGGGPKIQKKIQMSLTEAP